mgnify:CR=1
MKHCKVCGLDKPFDQFNKHPKTKDGRKPKCRDCEKEYNRQWREMNPEYNREWNEKHKRKRNKYVRKYKQKKHDDIWKSTRPHLNEFETALSRRVRRRINNAFKRRGFVVSGRTTEIIGCGIKELKAHLESQFADGMSWDNKDQWHIDHIIPLDFARDEKHLRWLCHYTNLQPLWADDNMKKSNKMPDINGDVK